MIIKRITACVLCVLLMAGLSLAVNAERPESMETLSKLYVLNINETQGSIEAVPATPAFWEYPVLRAGEDYIEGSMVVRNNSDYTATMKLENITLPYGSDLRLRYLDHLQLTVTEGDQVLYDNTYAHVNDAEGGLKIVLENMAPGEEHRYTIKLYCRYDYAGDPYKDVAQVAWLFGASTQTTTFEQPTGLPAWALITVITFAVMIAALVIMMVVRAVIAKKNEKSIDNDEQV